MAVHSNGRLGVKEIDVLGPIFKWRYLTQKLLNLQNFFCVFWPNNVFYLIKRYNFRFHHVLDLQFYQSETFWNQPKNYENFDFWASLVDFWYIPRYWYPQLDTKIEISFYGAIRRCNEKYIVSDMFLEYFRFENL